MRSRPPWRVLGHGPFGRYFAGNLASNCGTWFQNIAQALLVFRLTHSVLLVGVANFAQFIGLFVLSPWSGAAADRFDRRRLLLVTQLGAIVISATMAVVTATGHATATVVIALAVVLGLTTAFAIPAIAALVPTLVERRDLPAAIAMNTVSFTLAIALGPLAGALVVARFGLAWAFAANSVSYLALVVALASIHPPGPPAAVARRESGLRLVRGRTPLLVLLAIVGAVAVSGDPVNTLSPAFVTSIYHHPDTWTGALLGAYGLGAVIAAVQAPAMSSARRTATVMAMMGAGMVTFGLSNSLVVGLLGLTVAGYGYLSAQIAATTHLQLAVDESERGRVMAVWSMAWLGVRPFASLSDGGLGRQLGIRPAAVILALPVVVGAIALVRSVGGPTSAAREAFVGVPADGEKSASLSRGADRRGGPASGQLDRSF